MTPTSRKLDPIVFIVKRDNHLISAVRDAWRVQIHELCSRYEQLTARERQVFELVTDGLPNKQVARQLEISEITVQIHRSRVMRKMSASSFASLVRMADALQVLCEPPSTECATALAYADRDGLTAHAFLPPGPRGFAERPHEPPAEM